MRQNTCMNTCDRCKHWKLEKQVAGIDEPGNARVCEVLTNNSFYSHEGNSTLGCGCYHVSGSDSYFRTLPKFGCIHHAASIA